MKLNRCFFMNTVRVAFIGTVMCLMIAGCTSYYEISEAGSTNIYYTTKFKRNLSGAIEFKDSRTGATVVLQSSEVKKISKERYVEETQ